MVQVTFAVFAVFLGLFTAVMLAEPRSLWSGAAFFLLMLSLGGLVLIIGLFYGRWAANYSWLVLLLVILAGAAVLLVLAFPLLLFFIFLIEGVKVVKHEGLRLSNLLSLGFALLWFGFLFVWPMVGVWSRGSFGTALYILISFSALYMLALMAMYVLSALLNLIHFRKARRLDYIIVLGAGVLGSTVPPLLAARIERGMSLLAKNPGAMLILSGGQGPGEDLPESDAMAAYAVEHGADPTRILLERESSNTEENLLFSQALMIGPAPRVALVTTAYHVFRALLIAKSQGLRCIGFGSKTKWYFTLNAILREFAGYLRLTRRRHIKVLGAAAGLVLLLYGAMLVW